MVTELRDGVWWIELGGVNAYLVDDDGALTLVDAGMPWHGGDVVDAIVEAGFVLADLDRILVTHYDLDHVGGLPRLDGLDVTIYAGESDAPIVAGRRAPAFTVPKGAFQRVVGPLITPPDNDVVPLSDGDQMGSFTVYETPGHTDGHLAFVSADLGVAFLGDLVRESGGDLSPSPWIISADTDEVRRSIRKLVDEAPPFEVAAMGHGVPFDRAGRERLDDLAGRI